MVGGELEGSAVAPAADEFGGEFFFASGVEGGLLVEPDAEGGEVLVEFAVDHEGTVGGEQVGDGGEG